MPPPTPGVPKLETQKVFFKKRIYVFNSYAKSTSNKALRKENSNINDITWSLRTKDIPWPRPRLMHSHVKS